jgi:hypothetical protein
LFLQDEADALVILDFKSAGHHAKRDCFVEEYGLLRDFQMPMYNAILKRACGMGADAAADASVKKYFVPAGSCDKERTRIFAELE